MATLRNRYQFNALFSDIFTHVQTGVDIASLADGAGASQTVTVTGVALGDIVLGVAFGVSTAGVTVTGNVTAADTVTLRVQNESGGVVDLASTTVKLVVGRPADAVFI